MRIGRLEPRPRARAAGPRRPFTRSADRGPERDRGAPHLLRRARTMVQRAADRDRLQPGPEPRLAPESRKRLPRREKDLLHDILRVLVMPEHAPDDGPDPLEMRCDEARERLAIAAAGARHEGRFTARRAVILDHAVTGRETHRLQHAT